MFDPYEFVQEARRIYCKKCGPNPHMARLPKIVSEAGLITLTWKNELGYTIARFTVKTPKGRPKMEKV